MLKISHRFSSISKLHTSSILEKLIPEHKKRRQRHINPPFHSIKSVKHAPVDKVIFSDDFTSENEGLSMKMIRQIDNLRTTPNVYEKLIEMYFMENNFWHHFLELPSVALIPEQFSQYVTRSINAEPFSTKNPQIDESIRNSCNKFLADICMKSSHNFLNNKYDGGVDTTSSKVSQIIEYIYQFLSKHQALPIELDFLPTSKVETFFKHFHRSNVEPYLPIYEYDPERPDINIHNLDFDETQMGKDGCIRYCLRSNLSNCIYASKPLKNIFDMSIATDIQENVSKFNFRYHPKDFDLDPVDCLHYSNMPHHNRGPNPTTLARTVAGYWAKSPFWPDPKYQFSVLGCLDLTHHFKEAIEIVKSPLINDTQIAEITRDYVSANANLVCFAWASSQAYNQGFTMYNDVSYPLPVQLLLVNGNQLYLASFQMHTLKTWNPTNEISKDSPVNLFHLSDPVELFEGEKEKNRITQEALQLIVGAMNRQINTDLSLAELRPYLSDGDRESSSSIAKLIPEMEDVVDTNDQGTEANQHSFLKSSELKALREIEMQDKKGLSVPQQPSFKPGHPNEMFYFKTDNKNRNRILEEFRAEMEEFGGPFGQLHPYVAQIVAEYNKSRRRNQLREKLEKPPRTWK